MTPEEKLFADVEKLVDDFLKDDDSDCTCPIHTLARQLREDVRVFKASAPARRDGSRGSGKE